jgi:hypothetical protein
MVDAVPVDPMQILPAGQWQRDWQALRTPLVVKQQHIADDCRTGGVAKKVLCFTWFLGSIANAYIRYVVSLVTNVVCRLRIFKQQLVILKL